LPRRDGALRARAGPAAPRPAAAPAHGLLRLLPPSPRGELRLFPLPGADPADPVPVGGVLAGSRARPDPRALDPSAPGLCPGSRPRAQPLHGPERAQHPRLSRVRPRGHRCGARRGDRSRVAMSACFVLVPLLIALAEPSPWDVLAPGLEAGRFEA